MTASDAMTGLIRFPALWLRRLVFPLDASWQPPQPATVSLLRIAAVILFFILANLIYVQGVDLLWYKRAALGLPTLDAATVETVIPFGRDTFLRFAALDPLSKTLPGILIAVAAAALVLRLRRRPAAPRLFAGALDCVATSYGYLLLSKLIAIARMLAMGVETTPPHVFLVTSANSLIFHLPMHHIRYGLMASIDLMLIPVCFLQVVCLRRAWGVPLALAVPAVIIGNTALQAGEYLLVRMLLK